MVMSGKAGSDEKFIRQLMPKRYRFSVARVEKTDAPDGDNNRPWHRYVLVSECTEITGFCTGNSEEVQAHAHQVAEELNTRNGSAPGGWTSRQMQA